jgi:hypothetical protein
MAPAEAARQLPGQVQPGDGLGPRARMVGRGGVPTCLWLAGQYCSGGAGCFW